MGVYWGLTKFAAVDKNMNRFISKASIIFKKFSVMLTLLWLIRSHRMQRRRFSSSH